MSCQEILGMIEEIAAGDLSPAPAVRAHLETCPRCAAALATARRIEATLVSRPAPPAPARFTPTVISRIRRERWQTEQQVDRVFNVAIVVALLLIVGSVLALTNLGAVMTAASRSGVLIGIAVEQLAGRAVPLVNTYIAGACLLVSGVVMWWWAERQLTL